MLVLTGFKAALAAEIVSLWICDKVPLFDFRSVVSGFPIPLLGGGNAAGDAEEGEGGGGADDGIGVGSEVIRSINVVPEESCTQNKRRKLKPSVYFIITVTVGDLKSRDLWNYRHSIFLIVEV